MAAYNLQLKRKTASALENVYVSTKWELVDGKPSWIGSNKPSYTWSEIGSKPTTFNPSSHSHGNITNDGKIGTTANRVIVTGTGGILTAKAAGTTSQFLRGDGNWATPTANIDQAADFTWTGKHTFDISPSNDKAIEFKTSLGALPKFTATIETPEGSYTREWLMPRLSGELATLDNIPDVVYGYCSTSASTTAKVVSSNTFTSHKAGQIYVIEFLNGNTATAPTININSTGAIGVRHLTTNGAVTTSPGTDIMYARSRTVWTFVYNGGFLIPIGKSTRYWNALETKMLGYSKGSSSSAITTSDTVSSAIGKLEYRLDSSSGGGLEVIATGVSNTATGSGQMLNAQASGQMNSNKPYLIIVSGYDHEGVLRHTTMAHAQYEVYGGFFMDAGIVVEIGAFNMGNFEVHAQGMSTSTYRKIEVTLVGYKT